MGLKISSSYGLSSIGLSSFTSHIEVPFNDSVDSIRKITSGVEILFLIKFLQFRHNNIVVFSFHTDNNVRSANSFSTICVSLFTSLIKVPFNHLVETIHEITSSVEAFLFVKLFHFRTNDVTHKRVLNDK